MKYLFDKILSAFGLLLFSPVFIIISILILIIMPNGPVIFRQKRVGRNRKLFVIYKFRTMTVDHCGSTISVKGEYLG